MECTETTSSYLFLGFFVGRLKIVFKYVKSLQEAIYLIHFGVEFIRHATQSLGSLMTCFALIQISQIMQHVVSH